MENVFVAGAFALIGITILLMLLLGRLILLLIFQGEIMQF
ncbi:hypothetical protein HMPREF1885_00522 [Streptococcus agalactiae]|nr:hypothetical protein A6J82_00625 [Streptococcus agalactiae]CCW39172.1 hypothetical protein MSA_2790 [Streptococcus agalactiae ILRI005]KXA59745.1 hypothetical protein HMPREF1885_00522 [Streptococcus agalactiae]OTG49742.1 hypothetical protein B7934_01320 [Streptococcus agalactiae]RRA76415.1 hypothetical protein D5F92_03345 [Streptococcus agalactiae]